MKIREFAVEHLTKGCITDEAHPLFTYYVEDHREGAKVISAVLNINGWSVTDVAETGVRYAGEPLLPYTTYHATLQVRMDNGDADCATVHFETGRMGEAWRGQWISDGSYVFKEKRISPKPMHFFKTIQIKKKVAKARLYATALGIYECYIDGRKVGDRYFAPGFTSYESTLLYQTYDVTEQMKDTHQLSFVVAGGWAVGSFVFTRVNRVSGDRQALLAELHLEYEDGSTEIIGTDTSWEVTEEGPFTMVDLYDGETYDATKEGCVTGRHMATEEKLRIHPTLFAEDGAPVKLHETFTPVSVTSVGNEYVYDFGQNMAGVIRLHIRNAKEGQRIVVRHAEILNPDGSLNTSFLRTAKATATYICHAGEQVHMPSMTYMGFQYVAISGIAKEDVTVEAVAMYSDVPSAGSFACSNEQLNQLQRNILWGAKSNFVDIPTDCPQRDERMGWTGDINVFAPVACYNFDMSRFLTKWLRDMRSEQLPTGGIPNTIPVQGYGFPATMPKMAIDWWGDACVSVPWNIYMSYGDVEILKENYPMMKKYVKACQRWAALCSIGSHRYIWHTPATLHFGDWVAADVPTMQQWQKRSKWTATASLFRTATMIAIIARILGEDEDAKKFEALAEKVANAYEDIFTDGYGKLKEEFQTGYVLPLYLGMFRTDENQKKAAENLAKLVQKNDYCIGTGFPGTPYILFALLDNGQQETAYRMLLNEKCPSWLYEVKTGATTIWERWDGLDEQGMCPIGDDGTDKMISYNHYASGAVGDFLYRRVLGIEASTPGYKRFRMEPMPGGEITSAEGKVRTPYGWIAANWQQENGAFHVSVTVPVGCECELVFPSSRRVTLQSGSYEFTE
ncbi:MAG: glycoside hydrolase family 78 protein [Lachnospiraceae bacterium]|nr:glycoside hydrolase family 78 protein [Lachnospiraceae bacterium]